MAVGFVRLGSQAAKFGLKPGDEINQVLVPAERPSRYWFAIRATDLLGSKAARKTLNMFSPRQSWSISSAPT
ncbi:hypothetical protein [Mesorhizobium sp. M0488]|uniref:hypothetical protein n=1 Tax=unclassified Mesorhizobium TaxID=325217 RepID=UPI0033378500